MTSTKFDRHTTGTEVAETFKDQIRGKTVLVTGPSPGSIGKATALAIAGHQPALLILAGRTPAKLDAVATSCREVAANNATNVSMKTVQVDFLSLASVRSAASEISALTDRLDVLINNAGISTAVLRYSREGFESQFATNHLGPFLLTKLLLPLLLRASPGARVVNVSSTAQWISPVRFSDINFENEVDGPKKGKIDLPKNERPHSKSPAWTMARSADGFPGTMAYGQSKTANVLFTVALKRRLAGQGIDILALHPGEIRSNLGGELSPEFKKEIKTWPARRFKTLDQGCATTLVAAFDPELSGTQHVYLQDCQVARPARWADDPDMAERLWQLSEQMVNESSTLPGSKL
ncbi:NAD(P)-binding protein [Cryphonectria parasitica EP155]|uniref:NAD(P)-binding protein n=1 Tax=Cryphonectria parasitica (strain ATCC 38755 / EP155) TaxID=660469 RepID=A0A9P5CSS8_CRYP1|nr:NAD(P)-binding protein [Cryphonectria parasitica EP155]KAF3769909.1 NAD(P)-binding protein [Cryphonectria parasitica EP155]